MQRLGWAKGRCRQARVLGRVITLQEGGAIIEPDPALLEEVVHLLGLEGATPVITPAVKEDHLGDISSQETKARRLAGEVRTGLESMEVVE